MKKMIMSKFFQNRFQSFFQQNIRTSGRIWRNYVEIIIKVVEILVLSGDLGAIAGPDGHRLELKE
jgi:hypothetical protein